MKSQVCSWIGATETARPSTSRYLWFTTNYTDSLTTTLQREWRSARAWLYQAISQGTINEA